MLKLDSAALHWRAARCNHGACIEVATVVEAGSVAVRDSKNPKGPILVFSDQVWRRFVDGAKGGDFGA